MANPLFELLGDVGYVLDTPGALTRGLLSGRPFERASGREMLESWGILDPNKEGFDAGDVAGFGADVIVDPLNILGAGILGKLLGKADDAGDFINLAGDIPLEHLRLAAPKPPAPLFYSRLERAAEKLPESFKAESLPNLLKKVSGREGVSTDEMNWVLRGFPTAGRTTRGEVLKHVRENAIDVKWGKSGKHSSRVPQGEGNAGYREYLAQLPEIDYAEHNFPTEPGVIGHARVHDVPLGSAPGAGKKLQWIEAQSTLQQDAAKYGYRTPRHVELLQAEDDWTRSQTELGRFTNGGFLSKRLLDKYPDLRDPSREFESYGKKYYKVQREDPLYKKLEGELYDNYMQAFKRRQVLAVDDSWNEDFWLAERAPPDAPFKSEKAWSGLLAKKVLREAAEDPEVRLIEMLGGNEVREIVGGKLGGQQAYYDKALPSVMKSLLDDLGAGELRSSSIPAHVLKNRYDLVKYKSDLENQLEQFRQWDEAGYPSTNPGWEAGYSSSNPSWDDLTEDMAATIRDAERAIASEDEFLNNLRGRRTISMTPDLRQAILQKSWPLLGVSPIAMLMAQEGEA